MRIRKRTLVTGAITACVVGAACFGVVSMLGIESSKAAFQKTGMSTVEVQAGNLEFEMAKLENVAVANAGDTFDSDGVAVGTVVGNTTEAGRILSYTVPFEDIYPGWSQAYGFQVKNTGTLESFFDMYLGSVYLGESDATVDWDEQDPRTRIKFTIYKGTTLGDDFAKLAEGHLQGETVVVDNRNETLHYGNFQIPGKVPNTSGSLEEDSVFYYVIKLEFEDNDTGWVGNNAGDNVYEKAKFNVNIGIGTAGPLQTGFEFGEELETTTQANPTP